MARMREISKVLFKFDPTWEHLEDSPNGFQFFTTLLWAVSFHAIGNLQC